MKLLRILTALLFLTSCGAIVNYDYEKNTDFSTYKTYDYFTDMKTGFSQLDDKRFIGAIDKKLETLGFEQSETPSFRIDIQSVEAINNFNNTVGVGIGGTGNGIGGVGTIGIPINSNRNIREVSIEFVDDSKNGVFWQAETTISNIGNSPEKREASFVKLVEKIFSKYPPKK
ncbi:MAG: DUF4136 domain-containing protein [Winogradskyella sp.]|uniref:DUF4136 domain-containing protein n=1 Tax=Winogradskyella sp. TaxID=1883156 RepID=UPI0017B3FFF2|nr:DUF4136 domain-containing protein [Winogradskyella sp.]MBT8244312.1 DUF4136 domain-containing protein [Winogradskyella sp.]NNK23112.1 DUF4136 domain-containing protein [Winogradskyella sp.]